MCRLMGFLALAGALWSAWSIHARAEQASASLLNEEQHRPQLKKKLVAPRAPRQVAGYFRVINAPRQDNSYQEVKTRVISTQKEMNAFMKQYSSRLDSLDRGDFLKALARAKINFAKEFLLLITQTEPSGSNRVKFVAPRWRNGKLTCEIRIKRTQFGTCDMAYYCLAIVVNKGKTKRVEVRRTMISNPEQTSP
jgi:hypothetical protein